MPYIIDELNNPIQLSSVSDSDLPSTCLYLNENIVGTVAILIRKNGDSFEGVVLPTNADIRAMDFK